MSEYSDLAALAAQGTLERVPGTQRHGQAAQAMVDDILMSATGTATPAEAYALTVGRPSLNRQTTGPSRMWRLRVPDTLDQQVRAYATAHGRTISDITRAAVAAYIA